MDQKSTETPSSLAYRVPFSLSRLESGELILKNVSSEVLFSLRFSFVFRNSLESSFSSGSLAVKNLVKLLPGQSVLLWCRSSDRSSSRGYLVVRWFRSNVEEYLWQIVF